MQHTRVRGVLSVGSCLQGKNLLRQVRSHLRLLSVSRLEAIRSFTSPLKIMTNITNMASNFAIIVAMSVSLAACFSGGL